jgi:hypothetical protein
MHPAHKIFSCAFVAVTIFTGGVMTGSGAAPAPNGGMPVGASCQPWWTARRQ